MRPRSVLFSAGLFILALLIGLILFIRQPTAEQPGPADLIRVTQVDTSAYPAVALYVTVRDASGEMRRDLGGYDFHIIEDGVAVELSDFVGAGGSAIHTVLVVDRSGSMDEGQKMVGARQAAQAFVGMLRSDDQVALIGFNDQVAVLEPFTADQIVLDAAIRRLRAEGGTALYDSIVAGVDLLRDQPGRRALVVLTDGQDCRDLASCPNDVGSSISLNAAIAYANAANQPVTVIGLGERGSPGDDGIDEAVLERIAAETRGSYAYSPDAVALADLYRQIAGGLQSEYRLTYRSPRPFYDGTRRDIRVEVAGAQAVAAYTERHLIAVTAHPLVGLALLLPLLSLLVLPTWWRGRATSRPPTILPIEEAQMPAAHCVQCAAPLRAGARFCGRCGTSQPQPEPGRRTFCDMCGRPLAPGANVCAVCGEPAHAREQSDE
ncbi:VWA domain-containing protein [Candidatus Oscillochloris fontis]|uniref:VWA domain-containing protein n=1 Tax=Candidatus Oscillochloris fontis TaxID=2496868 RepID=UPI001375C716|nr:VWA domain-containing protein [Candidatus Oscillochloris fontis]